MRWGLKRRLGRLTVEVDFQQRSHFYLTLHVSPGKQWARVTWGPDSFELPPGTYRVTLRGLLRDVHQRGGTIAPSGQAYGTFEQGQEVTILSGQVTHCRFQLPKFVPVWLQVIRGQEAVRGAEVLVQDVDPNFRATNDWGDVLFHLNPGWHRVVIAHDALLVKESLRVDSAPQRLIIDLKREAGIQPSAVVVRGRSGQLVKGVTQDLVPWVNEFKLELANGEQVQFSSFAELKAVFFVKSWEGNRHYVERKSFMVAPQFGRKTRVVFADGEEITGYTLPGHTDHASFFLFPVDPQSNNVKIYIVRDATRTISLRAHDGQGWDVS